MRSKPIPVRLPAGPRGRHRPTHHAVPEGMLSMSRRALPRIKGRWLVSFSAVVVAIAGVSIARIHAEAAEAVTTPVYIDTRYSFVERAADLVWRMTLGEKVAQLST